MKIDDLNDEMLLEILCRLLCYRTALRCKAVSKHWYSLISDPLFLTRGFLIHRKVKKEPSFVFLLTMRMWDKTYGKAMVAPPRFQRTVWSPFLSLQFLPFHSSLVATFKDLILTFSVNPVTSLGEFYICNPLTKQWMVLPPCQVPQKQVIWAALTYLDEHGFRVVVAYSHPNISTTEDPFKMINLFVYISETCQWRNIHVRLKLSNGKYDVDSRCYFKGIACNKGMVCIWNGKHFGAFNPFDVTDTFHGTLTAIDLPVPGLSVLLSENDGNLIAYKDTYITLKSDSNGNLDDKLSLSQPWPLWKCDLGRLENDEQHVEWELISQLDGNINVKGSILNRRGRYYHFRVVGVHPTNERLLYLLKWDNINRNHQLILLDTKSKTLEPLTTIIPPNEIIQTCNYKLDIPSWPTPIPFR